MSAQWLPHTDNRLSTVTVSTVAVTKENIVVGQGHVVL